MVLKTDWQDQQIQGLVIDFFFLTPCDNFSLDVRGVSSVCLFTSTICLSVQINYHQEVLIRERTAACKTPQLMSPFFALSLWSG